MRPGANSAFLPSRTLPSSLGRWRRRPRWGVDPGGLRPLPRPIVTMRLIGWTRAVEWCPACSGWCCWGIAPRRSARHCWHARQRCKQRSMCGHWCGGCMHGGSSGKGYELVDGWMAGSAASGWRRRCTGSWPRRSPVWCPDGGSACWVVAGIASQFLRNLGKWIAISCCLVSRCVGPTSDGPTGERALRSTLFVRRPLMSAGRMRSARRL